MSTESGVSENGQQLRGRSVDEECGLGGGNVAIGAGALAHDVVCAAFVEAGIVTAVLNVPSEPTSADPSEVGVEWRSSCTVLAGAKPLPVIGRGIPGATTPLGALIAAVALVGGGGGGVGTGIGTGAGAGGGAGGRRRSRGRRRRRRRRRCRRSAPHNQTHARAVGEFATVRWALRNHAVLLTRSREDVPHAPDPTVRLADSCLCDDGRPPDDGGNTAIGFDRPSCRVGRRSCPSRHRGPYAQGEGKQTGGRYLLNHFASPLWRLVFVGGCRTTNGCLDYQDSPAPSLTHLGQGGHGAQRAIWTGGPALAGAPSPSPGISHTFLMTARQRLAVSGDVERALTGVGVPSYVLDRTGIVRWLNPAAERLVGDVRGRQFTSSSRPRTGGAPASDSLRRCSAPPWPGRRPAVLVSTGGEEGGSGDQRGAADER